MNRPLNVLRVITWMPVGGIERRILAVLPRLDPEKFRPRLVCIRERGVLADELEKAGVPVEVCPLRSRLSPLGIRRLAALMRRWKIDIVHAHMYRSSVPATIAARLAKVPVVIAQVHNMATWETARQRRLDRFLCRWRSAVVAVSESVRQDIIENLSLAPEKVRVVYNGIEIERFDDPSLREPARAALGLGPKDVAIIYHGRLVAQKNPEALVKIACEIGRRHRDVVVLVAGDGPRRADLERLAAEKGATKHIRFLGRREDIPALLQASDIYALPSLKEGFSNALLEAMAAGLPVVATDVGGNAEAVEHGRSGWIVPARDDGQFLSAVADLVDHPQERARMAAEAKNRARVFSLENMVRNVEALYTDLAREAGVI